MDTETLGFLCNIDNIVPDVPLRSFSWNLRFSASELVKYNMFDIIIQLRLKDAIQIDTGFSPIKTYRAFLPGYTYGPTIGYRNGMVLSQKRGAPFVLKRSGKSKQYLIRHPLSSHLSSKRYRFHCENEDYRSFSKSQVIREIGYTIARYSRDGGVNIDYTDFIRFHKIIDGARNNRALLL